MRAKRTDLAAEAREIFEENAVKKGTLQGVRMREYRRRGCDITAVDITEQSAATALQKPVGHYLTVDLRSEDGERFFMAVRCVAEELRRMLPPLGENPVLVVGLGNRGITPDAVGPLVVENILVTRHLKETLPGEFSAFTPVCALAAGVLGTTGVESAEIVRGLAERIKPACIIAVDALVSRRMERLCKTVQISDAGIVPGSGVGNHRSALTEEVLHRPVLALGVPTVIEAATLAADLLEEQGLSTEEPLPATGGIVTTRDIDQQVRELSRILACGINLALQPKLSLEDLMALMGQ